MGYDASAWTGGARIVSGLAQDSLGRHHRSLLLDAQGGTCFFCPQRITVRKRIPSGMRRATVDHLIPRHLEELRSRYPAIRLGRVLACEPCNHAKADRRPTEDEIARALDIERRLLDTYGDAFFDDAIHFGW